MKVMSTKKKQSKQSRSTMFLLFFLLLPIWECFGKCAASASTSQCIWALNIQSYQYFTSRIFLNLISSHLITDRSHRFSLLHSFPTLPNPFEFKLNVMQMHNFCPKEKKNTHYPKSCIQSPQGVHNTWLWLEFFLLSYLNYKVKYKHLMLYKHFYRVRHVCVRSKFHKTKCWFIRSFSVLSVH